MFSALALQLQGRSHHCSWKSATTCQNFMEITQSLAHAVNINIYSVQEAELMFDMR